MVVFVNAVVLGKPVLEQIGLRDLFGGVGIASWMVSALPYEIHFDSEIPLT